MDTTRSIPPPPSTPSGNPSGQTADPRVAELLEEILTRGRPAEEVCAGSPDLLPVVLDGLRALNAVEAELAVIFPEDPPIRPALSTPPSGTSPPQPTIPGHTVIGLLGHGGMGVVYQARHLKLDRTVAVKTLLSGQFAAPAELARFLREAQAIAMLRHPHIVQVYDIGEFDGRPYFTMEYLEGGSLAQQLSGVPQTASRAAALVATLADAVAVAHASGIIHRDLKPANILLTADGTPKVTDFGLARRSTENTDLTLGGTRLGTPGYMSPEQAIGREGTVGPPTDIYSLGAILYEMLTGRPPFQGHNAAETERQLLSDDPPAPRQLNPAVPRDLEVICQKCLHKSATSRYPSAQALADDLRRFQAGQPITARPVGPAERTVKWIRRSPAKATLLASALLATLAIAGGSLWALSSHTTRIASVEADLAAAVQFQRKADWTEAATALQRATIRLGDAGPPALRAKLARTASELSLVDRLESIRLFRAGSAGGVVNNMPAAERYAKAFREANIGEPGDPPAAVAARIGETAIAPVLVAALDDWATSITDTSTKDWLSDVTSLADLADDPDGWRHAARDPANWASDESIKRLIESATIEGQPPTFLYAFGGALVGAGFDPLDFLKRAQPAHPKDLWLTTSLANALRRRGQHAESVGYYRAAVALRPDAMAVHQNLGLALGELGRHDDAIACFREALRCDPEGVYPLKSLGLALANSNRHEEAVTTYLQAMRRDDKDYALHGQLAWSYANLGQYELAAESYRRALELGPKTWKDGRGTPNFLLKRGRHKLVQYLWQSQLDLKTTVLSDWDGFAEFCLFCDDEPAYRSARAQLLSRFADSTDPVVCECLARACLLLPPDSPDQLARATALIERSLATETPKRSWRYPYFRLVQALTQLGSGDTASAAAAATIAEGESAGILFPAPTLVASLCRARLGDIPLARKHLAAAALGYDWTPVRADHREAWIYHALRRQAERLLLPDLEKLLDGNAEPADSDTRLALLAACQASERLGRCAQLWTTMVEDALAAVNPPTDPSAEQAARALVLAGCGAGTDRGKYTDTDRAAWRQRALSILTARLDMFQQRALAEPSSQAALRTAVAAWHTAPEYQPVRDTRELMALPDTEQPQWAALWAKTSAFVGQSPPARR